MATPQSTTSNEPARKKPLEQITFRFCSECSNMLYPKEDEDSHKLQFTCRTCQFTEEAQSTCVFRNVLNNAAGETAGVTQDVGSDPTVGDALPAHACVAMDADQEEDALSPVLCICCGTPVRCSECGNTSSDFLAWVGRADTEYDDETADGETDTGYLDFLTLRTLTRGNTQEGESSHLAISVEELMDLMDIDGDDPFDEYDEERELSEDIPRPTIAT